MVQYAVHESLSRTTPSGAARTSAGSLLGQALVPISMSLRGGQSIVETCVPATVYN
jgi:hypothetical protein